MSKFDKYKRDSKAEKFYNSKAWRKTRNIVFQRDTGLCQDCLKRDKIVSGDVVHHKVELLDGEKGWALRLDHSNLITLCHDCHNSIHKNKFVPVREDVMFDSEGNLIRR
ncbi:HNH endonuclease signature motif containing protein [Rossellomorea oryzaecorticis]|uniref:Putative HNH nuclease YajD n=1 Tax=Rossellomorea oryzaecorticis TaxID=1396505 RepID=A0ABU9KC71_9BACI